MPAAVFSATVSWGAYLGAVLVLGLLMAPHMAEVYADSRTAAETRELAGVRALIDGLRPGTVATFQFGTPAASDSIWMSGHRIGLGNQTGSAWVGCRWALPSVLLAPGQTYTVRLVKGTVEVAVHG